MSPDIISGNTALKIISKKKCPIKFKQKILGKTFVKIVFFEKQLLQLHIEFDPKCTNVQPYSLHVEGICPTRVNFNRKFMNPIKTI